MLNPRILALSLLLSCSLSLTTWAEEDYFTGLKRETIEGLKKESFQVISNAVAVDRSNGQKVSELKESIKANIKTVSEIKGELQDLLKETKEKELYPSTETQEEIMSLTRLLNDCGQLSLDYNYALDNLDGQDIVNIKTANVSDLYREAERLEDQSVRLVHTGQENNLRAQVLAVKALQIREEIIRRNGRSKYRVEQLSGTTSQLGMIMLAQRKNVEAEAFYKRTVDLRREAFGEKSEEYMTALTNLSDVLIQLDKLDEAKKNLDAIYVFYKKKPGSVLNSRLVDRDFIGVFLNYSDYYAKVYRKKRVEDPNFKPEVDLAYHYGNAADQIKKLDDEYLRGFSRGELVIQRQYSFELPKSLNESYEAIGFYKYIP